MKTGLRAIVLKCAICVCLITVPALQAGWIQDGGPICIQPYHQELVALVSDGAGGAIITWQDARNTDFNIYVQRVNARGDTLWPINGIALCDTADVKAQPYIISDGFGGAIIAWMDRRNVSVTDWDIYAQRIDGSGNRLWSSDGLAVCDTVEQQWYQELIADGSGGVIIVWEDRRGPQGAIYGQRIDGNGTALWAKNGVGICTNSNYPNSAQIIPDGSGGAIITWTDTRTVVRNIYAQRINMNGVSQWQANGVPICLADDDQDRPALVSDGAGGAIIAWTDQRDIGTQYIYAQRVNANGNILWPVDGIPVCNVTTAQYFPQVVSDGSGGAIIVWHEGSPKNIHAQRLDGNGNPLWTSSGVDVCSAADNQSGQRIVADGSGGAIILWEDERNSDIDLYAQRLDAGGTPLWTANGITVCAVLRDQQYASLIGNGSGGAFFVWEDVRNNVDWDIYASLADADGQLVPVMLQQFTSQCRGGVITVKWSLATTLETKRFTVYRKDATIDTPWEMLTVQIEYLDGAYSFSDATCRPGSNYSYRVELSDKDGRQLLFESDPVSVPAMATKLYQNYPNPFKPSTTVSYYLTEKSVVTLSVFDASGRLVSKLVNKERKSAGPQAAEWNGRDDSGRQVASGVYFCRLEAGSFTQTRKMTLLR